LSGIEQELIGNAIDQELAADLMDVAMRGNSRQSPAFCSQLASHAAGGDVSAARTQIKLAFSDKNSI
jgi:hypothetical protein